MFHGSMVALVTPMLEDGEIDFDALERLVEYHIENGTDAIVSVGTTGESSTLGFAEHRAVVDRTVELVDGRVPVIAGSGANSTSEAVELTQAAMRSGVDACLLVTPYYNKPTQEGLYRHFRTIAEAADVPQILYNVPGRTAVDMLPETVERLADIPNIVGIKEASGNLDRTGRLVELVSDRMDIYSGDDHLARDIILQGGKGVISVTANVAPGMMHQMCAAALKGEEEKATEIDSRLAALHKALFVETSPIPVKWALAEMGLTQPGIRLPLTPLAEEYHEEVRQALRAADLT